MKSRAELFDCQTKEREKEMTRSSPQSLHQDSVNTDHEIKAEKILSDVLVDPNATKNPGLGAYFMLGLLILVGIGGILLLCYKCEHPTSFQIFQR
jgi:hypothetical protein